MHVERFSAVEIFGVPMDNPEDMTDVEKIVRLMGAYGIRGTEVTTELIDITPYYWTKNVFRYYLSRESEDSQAVIDIMPRYHDSTAYLVTSIDQDTLIGLRTPKRTIKIPTEQPALGVVGPSPRYLDHICIHEFIAVSLRL
jgi:hypothetical protein